MSTVEELPQKPSPTYGLHANALGPVETLAQSISAIAPSTSSSLTIPLVFALAGNGAWLVYLLATGAMLLVGACIGRFARASASPGSLYSYAAQSLPPAISGLSAWGLFIAYVATGASVAGGALYYVVLFTRQVLHAAPHPIVALTVVCAGAAAIACRNVKLSAQLMLWIEIVSVAMVLIVLAVLVFHYGVRIDNDQFALRGVHFSSFGPALVLSIFSFVGFESATALGAEARDPLRSIPRAVLQSALIAGTFFMLCAYSEVLGFRGISADLSQSTSPLHLLAERARISPLGIGIDIGALISMFACVLACTTAAARVLLRMAHDGMAPRILRRTSLNQGTPTAAIVASSVLMILATSGMALGGKAGFEMYDLAGSLSVFGFLTAYALVAVAAPLAERANGAAAFRVLPLSGATVAVIILIAVVDLRSASDPAHARIPWIYLGCLGVGLLIQIASRNGNRRAQILTRSLSE
ncbi:MAG TPA: APC family permease [Terracidiphilus sp.]|jgi:amino acid transporter|nr:APC family permease [Terracidiphilus sp.]